VPHQTHPPLSPLSAYPALTPLPGLPGPLADAPPLQALSGFHGPPAPPGWSSIRGGLLWDPSILAANFNTMTLQPQQDWIMDTGAETHMTSNSGTLSSPSSSTPSSIVVGDGSILPVTSTGSVSFPHNHGSFNLHNVLVSPSLLRNLISVHQFTIENSCSVEFDPFDFSVKDFRTKNTIIRCNSSGLLYPLLSSVFHLLALAAGTSSTLWHRRLGHIGHDALSRLVTSSAIPCNKIELESLCHACQLGRHVRLPFSSSNSHAIKNFDLIHCDLWTSPVISVSGYKYYLVVLDDRSL
jgi:hypothetical protein